MQRFLLCLMLFRLSIQLPHALPDASTFQTRAVAPFRYDLTRVQYPASLSIEKRQSIKDNAQRTKYLFPITVEGQTLYLELDTGSSDTWIIRSDFECYTSFDTTAFDFTGRLSEDACNFGPAYTPGAGFETVPYFGLLSCYGQSQFEDTLRCVNGSVGHVNLEFDGLIVQEQLVGAMDESSFTAYGEPIESGLLGMAMQGLVVDHLYNYQTQESVRYTPIMQTIFNEFGTQFPSQFALALSRDASNNGNGGILTIGGLPSLTDPAVGVSADNFTSAPWEYVTNIAGIPTTEFTFYSIKIDYVSQGDVILDDTSHLQILVDSGADTFEVPVAAATTLNSYWSPAGTYYNNGEDLNIECDAVLTQEIGVAIGGATYYISSEDLIYTNEDGDCWSLIQGTNGEQGYLIGDPLLKNVLAVFDWGNQVLSFYPRQNYTS